MKYKAYAKINLCLNNLGINNNGYHELDMILAQINLYDKLDITKTNEDCVIEGMDISQEDNLMYKAYIEYKKECNIDFGIKIYIEKNIPSEAGLGGGSSDAAVVLKALNEMNNNFLSTEQLLKIASNVGSDVSYFIYGGICRVQGTGQIVTPIKETILKEIVLIKPKYGLSTKDIYVNSDKFKFEDKRNIIEKNIGKILNNDFNIEVFNDLELPAIDISSRYSKNISYYKQMLMKNKACMALMTGSGSCVYGIYKNDNINDAYYELLNICDDEWVIKI